MNKIIRNTFVAFAAILGLTLASCTDKYEYQAASASGQQVYFDQVANKISLSKDANTFNVQVRRIATDEAATIALTSTDESGLFTIPGSVAFAAGEDVANVTIGYNPDVLEYDDFKAITLSLADADNTTPYGKSVVSFSAGIPSPFVKIGTGKWNDAYMFEAEVDADIYQNQLNPNVYRVMVDYDEVVKEAGGEPTGLKSDYVEITLLQVGDELAGTTITKPNMLYFSPFDMSYANSTGEMIAYHPVDFGWTSESYIGTSYISGFKEDGTPGEMVLSGLILVDFEGGRGWAPCNSGDPIAVITFPGYTPADYSAEMTYSGIFTDATGSVFAVANLTLGADAETVKAVVVDGSADAAAVADAIAAGDLEATDVKAGRIELPIAEDQTGALQIVAVVLDGENVKTVVSAPFEYYGGGKNPWQSLGIGYLTDDFVVTQYYETYDPDTETGTTFEPKTYEVEILENTDEPGTYRIVDAFKGVTSYLRSLTYESANIDVDATDPNAVYIPTQSTGLSDDGDDIAIATYGGYTGNPTYAGKLVDGVLKFPSYRTQSGLVFQGIIFFGNSGYYTGNNSAFQIVLPSAAQSVKAKAQRAAAAADFERRLNGGSTIRVKGEPVKKAFTLKGSTLKEKTLKK